jgi:hypothetical protein
MPIGRREERQRQMDVTQGENSRESKKPRGAAAGGGAHTGAGHWQLVWPLPRPITSTTPSLSCSDCRTRMQSNIQAIYLWSHAHT